MYTRVTGYVLLGEFLIAPAAANVQVGPTVQCMTPLGHAAFATCRVTCIAIGGTPTGNGILRVRNGGVPTYADNFGLAELAGGGAPATSYNLPIVVGAEREVGIHAHNSLTAPLLASSIYFMLDGTAIAVASVTYRVEYALWTF